MDVVVIDHHQVPDGPSDAFALINPHRPDDPSRSRGWPPAGWRFTWRPPCAPGCARRNHPPAASVRPARPAGSGGAGDHRRPGPAGGGQPHPGRRRPARAARPGAARGCACWPRSPSWRPTTAIDATTVSFRLTPRLNAPGPPGRGAAGAGPAAVRGRGGGPPARDGDRRGQPRPASASRRRSGPRPAPPPLLRWRPTAPRWWWGPRAGTPAWWASSPPSWWNGYRRPAVVVAFDDGVGRGSARTTGGFHLHAGLTDLRGSPAGRSGATPAPPA